MSKYLFLYITFCIFILLIIILSIIRSSILSYSWFHNIPISRKIIVSYSRPRFGHNHLLAHSFYYPLYDSPYCIRHEDSLLYAMLPIYCLIIPIFFIAAVLFPLYVSPIKSPCLKSSWNFSSRRIFFIIKFLYIMN